MNPIELYLFLKTFEFEYDSEITKVFSFEVNESIKTNLNEAKINYEERNGRIFIERQNLTFSYFENKTEFEQQVQLPHFDKPIIIGDYFNQNECYFSEVYENQNIRRASADDFFISNSKTFLESLDFFINESQKTDNSFDFVDFYSKSSKSLTFNSLSDKKRIKLIHPRVGVLPLNSKIDYRPKFDKLKSLISVNKQFPVFVKRALIKSLGSESGDDLYLKFFEKIDQITHEAELDYNVYLHELSIDKIKSDYKEYKQKYFASQNEILNKLTSQIIALPFSVSGTVFAISRLEKQIIPMTIVCIALLSYIVYISFLTKVYLKDINSLDIQSKKDYNELLNHLFFQNNKDELDYFKNIKDEINKRLKSLFFSLKTFTLIMWISIGLVVLYIISLIFAIKSVAQSILIVIIFCAILSIVFSYLFYPKNQLNENDL